MCLVFLVNIFDFLDFLVAGRTAVSFKLFGRLASYTQFGK